MWGLKRPHKLFSSSKVTGTSPTDYSQPHGTGEGAVSADRKGSMRWGFKVFKFSTFKCAITICRASLLPNQCPNVHLKEIEKHEFGLCSNLDNPLDQILSDLRLHQS